MTTAEVGLFRGSGSLASPSLTGRHVIRSEPAGDSRYGGHPSRNGCALPLRHVAGSISTLPVDGVRETLTDLARTERFRLMYDVGYPRIVAFALRRARTRDDAYDVVGDTFMTAWRRFDDAPSEEAWMAWLYGIARRVLANHYRSIDRRGRLVEKVGFASTPPTDEGDTGPEIVTEALTRLRPDDREILTLAAWDDLSNDEIAVVLDLKPQTAAVRLHRARKRLAKELALLGYPPDRENQVKSPEQDRTPERVRGTDSDHDEEASP